MTYRESAPSPVVVLAIDDRIFGIEPSSGEIRWEHEVIPGITSATTTMLITPTAVFACAGGKLDCVAYPTGELRWTAKVPGGRAAMLLEGGCLFVATSSGKLDCFTLDGQHLWQNPLKGKGTGYAALGVPGNVMQADDMGK